MAVKTRSIVAVSSEVIATVRSIASILNDIDASLIADNGPTCLWFAIQNKNAANSLYIQTSNATSGNANVELNTTVGQYKQYPPCAAKYDLNYEFIRVGTNNQIFSIEIMWG